MAQEAAEVPPITRNFKLTLSCPWRPGDRFTSMWCPRGGPEAPGSEQEYPPCTTISVWTAQSTSNSIGGLRERRKGLTGRAACSRRKRLDSYRAG